MSFLLDTNVVSEAVAKTPSPDVLAWVRAQPSASLHLSVATIAEIDFGIARLADSLRRGRLQLWRDGVVASVGGRILPVDLIVASAWAKLRARAQAENRTMPLIDALLAATADVHGLTLVTRNVRDFEAWPGAILNPWSHR